MYESQFTNSMSYLTHTSPEGSVRSIAWTAQPCETAQPASGWQYASQCSEECAASSPVGYQARMSSKPHSLPTPNLPIFQARRSNPSGSASSFLSCSPPTEESSILPAAKTGKRTFFKRGSGILFNQELRSQSLLLQCYSQVPSA
jgi:hypothetical protein